MIILINFLSTHMDHLVIIVIIINLHQVDHVVGHIIIVDHILNNVDEDEKLVVVQHLHRHRVRHPHLHRPHPVQHQDHIQYLHHHHLVLVTRRHIVETGDHPIILDRIIPNNKKMMKRIVQVWTNVSQLYFNNSSKVLIHHLCQQKHIIVHYHYPILIHPIHFPIHHRFYLQR